MRVDSDIPWGDGQPLRSLVIEVRAGAAEGELLARNVVALHRGDARASLPYTFGLSPRDQDATRRAWVQVSGCADANGCSADGAAISPLVTQRAIVGYVSRETRRLDLLLAARCRGRPCLSAETCEAATGACVSAVVPAERLRPASEVVDATVAQDVVVTDAPRADVVVAMDVPVAQDRPAMDRRAAADASDRPDTDRPDVVAVDALAIDAPDVTADTPDVAPDAGVAPDVASPPDTASPPDAPEDRASPDDASDDDATG